MDITIQAARPLHGRVAVPADKSICQRAVLIGALARGETRVSPWPAADDCRQMADLVEQLGVRVERGPGVVRIFADGFDGWAAPGRSLCCGESGATFRIAAGALATKPFPCQLTAGPRLSRRPMQRIVDPLRQMGAQVEGARSVGAGRECYPPLAIHGKRPLRAIRHRLAAASAQVKSSILVAGLGADGPTSVEEPLPTRDHTERLLRRCGVTVSTKERVVTVSPGGLTAPGPVVVPGDFSSAAFWIVAATCVPGSEVVIEQVGLNPTRTALVSLLTRMGAEVATVVEDEAWEPSGTITVQASRLRGITVEPEEAPLVIDELPVLMVAAACADGTTRLCGLAELRVKETDRIRSMVSGLSRYGVRVRVVEPDTVEIVGGTLRGGGAAESAGDHRTAMSLAVAALAAPHGRSIVRGAECVGKSFPEFFDQLRILSPEAVLGGPG